MRQGIQLVLVALLVLGLGYAGYRLIFTEDADLQVEVIEAQGTVRRVGTDGQPVDLAVGDEVDAE